MSLLGVKELYFHKLLLCDDSIREMKRQNPDWEKKSSQCIRQSKICLQICKGHSQLTSKKTSEFKHGLKNGATVLPKDIQVAKKHMKKCSMSLVIRET